MLLRKNILLIIFSVAAIIFLWVAFESFIGRNLAIEINQLLLSELIKDDSALVIEQVEIVYIFGGTQKSLEYKFITAATLFKNNVSKKFLILDRPGKTEYNKILNRNLTNNEWSIMKLESLGVPNDHVGILKMKEGFFGTLSEAKGLASHINEKKYKSIVLISAPYHTHRLQESFNYSFKKKNIAIYILSSEEEVCLKELLIEFFKLKLYQYFLIRN